MPFTHQMQSIVYYICWASIFKNGILFLPSWLWLGISHLIHLTKQEGKFEANNGEKEEKKNPY
jgi:hypothetical protein